MGYYSTNPHYLPEDYSGDVERLERAEQNAGWYYSEATKPQLARYNERMDVARAYKGAPRWDREKAAAEREYQETTAAARELFDATLKELLAAGEVSEELSARWDALDAAALLQAAE